VRALRLYTDESELYVAAARRGGDMHRTDLIGLAAVITNASDGAGAMTPGRLSAMLDLSPAATTAMLDRLEHGGHVTRAANPADRRSVIVEPTRLAHDTVDVMFAPLRRHMTALLATHTEAQLEAVAALVEAATAATRDARADVTAPRRRRR
jgi:DNA-binding MarR family transcriptional regulator